MPQVEIFNRGPGMINVAATVPGAITPKGVDNLDEGHSIAVNIDNTQDVHIANGSTTPNDPLNYVDPNAPQAG